MADAEAEADPDADADADADPETAPEADALPLIALDDAAEGVELAALLLLPLEQEDTSSAAPSTAATALSTGSVGRVRIRVLSARWCRFSVVVTPHQL
ncbi:hypothetical protein [Kitasatospora viridis]|uniref:hypothetical protein n=1 Tax=Kitasatospora viridis TaxID=281105 RepID=UPI00119E1713|nr:hypothetical protein [Kitasatospora viridis]